MFMKLSLCIAMATSKRDAVAGCSSASAYLFAFLVRFEKRKKKTRQRRSNASAVLCSTHVSHHKSHVTPHKTPWPWRPPNILYCSYYLLLHLHEESNHNLSGINFPICPGWGCGGGFDILSIHYSIFLRLPTFLLR